MNGGILGAVPSTNFSSSSRVFELSIMVSFSTICGRSISTRYFKGNMPLFCAIMELLRQRINISMTMKISKIKAERYNT
ncbi:hypothetical protein P3L10_028235 [Capsicum annuum]